MTNARDTKMYSLSKTQMTHAATLWENRVVGNRELLVKATLLSVGGVHVSWSK